MQYNSQHGTDNKALPDQQSIIISEVSMTGWGANTRFKEQPSSIRSTAEDQVGHPTTSIGMHLSRRQGEFWATSPKCQHETKQQ